jgi:acyl-coenzyme A thioesterase PaaI-like protein
MAPPDSEPDVSPPPKPPFDPAGAGWIAEPEGGFLGLVGPLWRRGSGTALQFGFVAEPKHANLIGVVQGGMMMTFADRGLGLMAWDAAGGAVVTVTFDMAFVDAGRIGSFIELDGEVVRRSASLVFMRGTLRTGARVLGTCQGTWKILSPRRRAAGSDVPA